MPPGPLEMCRHFGVTPPPPPPLFRQSWILPWHITQARLSRRKISRIEIEILYL